MRKILITGGTVFVSRYVARFFIEKGDEVYVLNRNRWGKVQETNVAGSKVNKSHLGEAQEQGAILLECDRHQLNTLVPSLKSLSFDAVLDMTAYTKEDVRDLTNYLGEFGDYIFLSSSAVYPETLEQPFAETQQVGPNRYWGAYGIGKYEAEQYLMEAVPEAYILRPPYLYGPMNNLYREAFVFDCAVDTHHPFFLPKDGSMKLQFFYIRDLCRFIESLLEKHPKQSVYNLGNPEPVSIRDWVSVCYRVAVDTEPVFRCIEEEIEQRQYFPFYCYEYMLDVSAQEALMPELTPLVEGLKESWLWYRDHVGVVRKKPFFECMKQKGWIG